MKLIYDRFAPRERVGLTLFVSELVAVASAAFYASDALSSGASPAERFLFLGWALVPRAIARIVEGSARAPRSAVAIVAAAAGLGALGGLSLGHFAEIWRGLAQPPLVALVTLWVSSALLFDPRLYRFHDVALLGALIVGLAERHAGAWWMIPAALVAFGLSTALRHLLHDVYVERVPIPLNAQASRALGWVGGVAAGLVFLVLTGLLWWIEPALAIREERWAVVTSEGVTEVARVDGGSESEAQGLTAPEQATVDSESRPEGDGAAGTESSEDEEPQGSTAGGAASDESTPIGEDETARVEGEGADEMPSAPEIDPGATDPEATEPDAIAPAPPMPELERKPDRGYDRLIELPMTLIDDVEARLNPFKYGAESLPPPMTPSTPVTKSSNPLPPTPEIGQTGGGGARAGAPSAGVSSSSQGSGLGRVGGASNSVGSRTATGARTMSSGAKGEVTFGSDGLDGPVEPARDIPSAADLATLRTAVTGEEEGEDETPGESGAPVDESATSAEELSSAAVVPLPDEPISVNLDFLPPVDGEATSDASLAGLVPRASSELRASPGETPADGSSMEMSEPNAADKGSTSEDDMPGEDPPWRWLAAGIAIGFVVIAARGFGRRERREREAAPTGGGNAVAIVPLALSAVEPATKKAAATPEEAILLAYDELQRALARRRFGRRPAETPREQQVRLVAKKDEIRAPFELLVGRFYDVLYGERSATASEAAQVQSSCDAIRRRFV
ncbi:MAG: DUF4129 domain-containing protein [Planctomycetes bacterium]|nr:DUF4129 domain-containing protein [Planctomycetota bacterium]